MLTGLVYGIPAPPGRLARSLSGRVDSVQRWLAFGASRNGVAAGTVWVHAASAGETLSAVPVVRALERHARLEFVRSYSSPSARELDGPFDFLHSDFIPPDRPRDVLAVLRAVRPLLIIFSRGDLWPVFTTTAARLGIPVAVIGGEMSRLSLRMSTLGRSVLAPAMAALSFTGVTTPGNAARWARAGAPRGSIVVTGDPRHDHVLHSTPDHGPSKQMRAWSGGVPVLLAGSTDRADERLVLAAFRQVCRLTPSRLVIAPHDPRAGVLARLRRLATALSVDSAEWDGMAEPSPAAKCLVLNRTGLLAGLYAGCDLAYVGGGFFPGKLHSVIEPAAYGVPVIAGTRAATDDFDRLLLAGGAVRLETRSPGLLAETWAGLMGDRRRLCTMGLAARAAVTTGAATLTAKHLVPLLRNPA